MESYNVLKIFKERLLQKGFDKLPENADNEAMSPFVHVYENILPEIKNTLLSDLSRIGLSSVRINESQFDPEDSGAQGSSIIYINAKADLQHSGVEITFKFLVFQDLVQCYLSGHLSTKKLLDYSKENSAFIRTLVKDYESGTESPLFRFFS